MKIQPRGFARFAARLDPALRTALVYGPDGGLVRERALALVRAVVPDVQDPFRIAELGMAAIADTPGRLAEEAAAMAFTGGRRVVRVLGASDRLSEPLAALLEDFPGDTLIVLEAAELGPRSSLRRLCEAAPNAAAIACYADDAEALELLVESVLHAAGKQVEADALDYLKANLGSDRGISRQELDKLVTYAGAGQRSITLADAQACIGDSSALSVDDVVDAAAGGQLLALDRAIGRSLLAGEAPVALIRAAQRHLQRLHLVAGLRDAGQPLEAALGRLRPALHFSRKDGFRAQLGRWPTARLAQALDLLTEAEIDCKSTGAADEVLARAALTRIAAAARSGRA
ncbi:MAG TPA: DNA polymerase III subunit delta [Candidatus Sulfotelmatobacter sp.]|nr:DNA polymerase III subunit delta [Candidatus Sulfotelmatobacter sp.]